MISLSVSTNIFSRKKSLVIIYLCSIMIAKCENDYCDAHSTECNAKHESVTVEAMPNNVDNKRYLLYDVNGGEGFNLRRDVYMRIASLVHKASQEDSDHEWTLVLPPWGPLYHWKSRDIGFQDKIPWSKFFDLPSLSKYVPVIEFHEFLNRHGSAIDHIYYLQHYPDMGASRQWQESVEESKCLESPPYESSDDIIEGWFWGYENVFARKLTCLSVQGSSSTLKPLLHETHFRAIMIERAEVILHDMFGDVDYWMVRRSMRFTNDLLLIGNEFRAQFLNSTDEKDKTVQSENWSLRLSETRSAVGGPYIAVHLRRQDFLGAKPTQIPNIKIAAQQIKKKMTLLNLDTVFVATDAHTYEFAELKQYLPEVIKYTPDKSTRQLITDGGIAIIDQWICAHARYFLGSYESTFSYRIHEEREILGFPADTTFNRLCGDNETICKQPTRWEIVYP